MDRMKRSSGSRLLSGIFFCLIWFMGCGDRNNHNHSSFDSGPLAFEVVYHGDGDHLKSMASSIKCEEEGIATVMAVVYGPGNERLASGGPWDCDLGHGAIDAVPAGNDRKVVILGQSAKDKIVMRGQSSDVDVFADSENNAGIIKCYAFVPSLLAPADEAVVEAGAIQLRWHDVSGANGYRVVVSEHGLPTPIIDETAPAANYATSGLSINKVYQWQIFAIDAFQNAGIGSEIRIMTVSEGPVNTSPVANIISPVEDAAFSASDAIVFAGSARDHEDGDLSGASLEWHSDVDGRIGTGARCASTTLVAGTHLITLTATDAGGATATDSVAINIPPGRVPYIDRLSYYTKLDPSGNSLEAGATSWAMVRDDVTGLIWEVKTDDGGINDKDGMHNWDDIQGEFINALNNANFGGNADWRLPTIQELQTVVHRGRETSPAIHTSFFPNTPSSDAFYWSSTTCADNAGEAWCTVFDDGHLSNDEKSLRRYVRAVRGGTKQGNYVETTETVTDTITGLMWQQVHTFSLLRTWQQALDYCENLELAGHDDWRLPNINELQSILDYERYDPSIDRTIFANTKSSGYWSSTSFSHNAEQAWGVQFISGRVGNYNKSTEILVRAVRGGH